MFMPKCGGTPSASLDRSQDSEIAKVRYGREDRALL